MAHFAWQLVPETAALGVIPDDTGNLNPVPALKTESVRLTKPEGAFRPG